MRVTPQPLIAVRDVRASTRWYAELFGLGHSVSEHDHLYQRMMAPDEPGGGAGERIVLQLHAWDEEDHPNLVNADRYGVGASPGHGVLIWFQVDDVDAVVVRAAQLNAKILHGPERNENSGAMEVWVEDLDGYVVVAAGEDG
jgi:predicted enzyme related to lactoylglutathione lyase